MIIEHDGKNYDISLDENERYIIDKNFPDYLITSKGRVYSFRFRKFINGGTQDGYKVYFLRDKNGKVRPTYAERLVWKLFGDKTLRKENKLNHNDNDKLNNDIDNLSWFKNRKELAAYRRAIGKPLGRPKKKSVFTNN